MTATVLPELSCYLLPGHTTTPADAIAEARLAEELGLGKAWLAGEATERFRTKSAAVIAGEMLADSLGAKFSEATR